MQIRSGFKLAVAGSLLVSVAAFAHHSNAMFDRTKELVLKGTIHQFQWTNPHVFIEMMVDDPKGPYLYLIETGAPSLLKSHGWKFNSLKPGDKVVAKVHPLKTGTHGGGLMSISKDGVMIGDGKEAPGYEGAK